jgi:hypothetical protein
MKPKIKNPALTVLEAMTPFSESMLWALQRQYFEEMGMDAWRLGEVPHYVTSNPRHAEAYGGMIIALYKDYRAQSGPDAVLEPMRILELGGGSGRMAFYILRRLEDLCASEGISLDAFRYILTDFTQRNLDFWRMHPRFQPYFESGLLDIGLLDAVRPAAVALQVSGAVVGVEPWAAPLVVVANYLFDSIPQELLYIAEGKCQRVAVSLEIEGERGTMPPQELLASVALRYAIADEGLPALDEAPFQGIIAEYHAQVERSYTLFPVLGIQCIAALRRWSQRGLMLLTADKGAHELGGVLSQHPPSFAAHGSISMNVNYHVLHTYCAQTGGLHFFPDHGYTSINTGCMLFLENATHYRATIAASSKCLGDTGPDTYFTLYKCVRANLEHMQLRDLLAALRLGLHDSHQLAIYIVRIAALVAEATPREVSDLLRVMQRCWENYFPLAEDRDLATTLGSICYAVDAYEWALYYFSQSTDIYGGYTGTFYNMAVCYHMLGDADNAAWLLAKVVAHDPENAAAQQLLAEYAAAPQVV